MAQKPFPRARCRGFVGMWVYPRRERARRRSPIDRIEPQIQGAAMTVQADEPMRQPVRLAALNLPNILTYGRIAAAPLVGATYYIPGDWGPWIAFLIFVTASITDYLDGYLARIWQQQSALGRMLDPIADKLLVSVSILVQIGRAHV